MKRHLKNDRYQLSDHEREAVWHGIRRDLQNEKPGRYRPTRTWRPALGLAAAAALLVVMGSWWLGSRDPQGMFGGDSDILVADASDVMEVVGVTELAEEAEPTAAPPPAVLTRQAPPKGPAVVEKKDSAGQDSDEVKSTVSREKTWHAEALTAAPVENDTDPAGIVVTGRVRDLETGAPLQHAAILVRGTTISAIADSNGFFMLFGLDPGTEIALQVMMLGYDRVEKVLSLPDAGELTVAYDLQPMTVAALKKPGEGSSGYMDESLSVGRDHRTQRDQPQSYSLDSAPMGRTKNASGSQDKDGRHGGAPPPPKVLEAQSSGSVTGGTTPPNGEEVELMYFDHVGVNPFVATEDDSLSTFALDVDNAAWTMARNYLERGMMPPKDAIRVEEFVNAFDAGWKAHTDDVFRIHTDGGLSRFGDGYHMLRIGVVGQSVDASERKPANLVFVIDISGSMGRENRLGAVKKALHVLLGELREGDSVGIVVYGSRGEVRLEPTDISDREKITQAIDALGTGGSTNVYEGLELAYRMARDNYEAGKLNRLILCSDGVANNGASTKAEEILDLVRQASDQSITISAIGFGMGNYNDVMMEKLADTGDGNYYYVDKHEEAERVFRENLTGLLQTIAREVKVQVDFDPESVTRWRLLGYENRDVADRDFRNDAVDAGEVGAGHQVTALYEVKLKPSPKTDRTAAVIRLRHEAPAHDSARAGQVEEIEVSVPMETFAGRYGDGSPWRRAQLVAAEFAEILRHSYWAKESRLEALVPLADALEKDLPGDAAVRDLAAMIRKAADIGTGQRDKDE